MTTPIQNSKKSETLEFRLPHDEKTKFLAQVSQTDQSASQVLRQLVEDYAQPNQSVKPKRWWFAGVVVAALGAAAAVPVLADRTLFGSYDVDGNGRITTGEISDAGDREIIEALDTDKNGWVSSAELKPSGSGETFKEITDDLHTGTPKRWLEASFFDFELRPERKVVFKMDTVRAPIAFDATPEQILRTKANMRSQMAVARKLPSPKSW
jgi:hypothetical protein